MPWIKRMPEHDLCILPTNEQIKEDEAGSGSEWECSVCHAVYRLEQSIGFPWKRIGDVIHEKG
jgi:hypothetical protein